MYVNCSYKRQRPKVCCDVIQEIHETHADMAHLSQVHGPIKLAGIDLRYTRRKWWSFARHEWMSHWNQDNNNEHVGVINAYHRLFMFGRHMITFDCTVHAKQVRSSYRQQAGTCSAHLHDRAIASQ